MNRKLVMALILLILTTPIIPLGHALVTTYEDYTSYTEYDGGTSITVGSAKEYTMKVQRTVYFWLLKDKGNGGISGTMHYRVEFKSDYANLYSTGYIWGVTNATGTSTIDLQVTDNFIGVSTGNNDPGKNIQVVTEHDGVTTSDIWNGAVANTWYYLDITKTTTTVTVKIYTTSDYSTTLVDTLTLAVVHTGPWKYLWASSGVYQGGLARLQNVNVANLAVITEDAPPVTGEFQVNYLWILILSPVLFIGVWSMMRRR